jgi:hypothetical protein
VVANTQVMAVGGVSTIFLGFGSQIVTTNFVSGIDLVRACDTRHAPEHLHIACWLCWLHQ